MKELNENIETAIRAFLDYNEQLRNPKSRVSKTEGAIQSKIAAILKKKHLDAIFETRINTHGGSAASVDFLINVGNKEGIAHKYFGKKLLITDRSNWPTAEIIEAYREQDSIEKIFRATKDDEHFAIRPQFHYTDQKIRVHIFCCLLGLTLATILHKEATERGFRGSRNKILDILASIRRCWIKDKNSNKVANVLEVMNEEQSALWDIVQAIK